jgi:serine/threonine protein kinase
MLTRGGLKLLDFGIAKKHAPVGSGLPDALTRATAAASATLEGTLIGTVPYMAPEQLEGQPVDARTDVFAFGSLLFEMATGRRAFHGTSTAGVVAAIMAEPRPRAADIDPSLPRTLDRLISTCVALKPEDRYQNVRDLLRELRWCEKDLSETASPSIPPRRSTSWLVHGAWAAALLVAVATALWFPPAHFETIARRQIRCQSSY